MNEETQDYESLALAFLAQADRTVGDTVGNISTTEGQATYFMNKALVHAVLYLAKVLESKEVSVNVAAPNFDTTYLSKQITEGINDKLVQEQDKKLDEETPTTKLNTLKGRKSE